jgi:hypothetical protein
LLLLKLLRLLLLLLLLLELLLLLLLLLLGNCPRALLLLILLLLLLPPPLLLLLLLPCIGSGDRCRAHAMLGTAAVVALARVCWRLRGAGLGLRLQRPAGHTTEATQSPIAQHTEFTLSIDMNDWLGAHPSRSEACTWLLFADKQTLPGLLFHT